MRTLIGSLKLPPLDAYTVRVRALSCTLLLVVGHDIDNTEHVYINVDTHSMSILERYKHELELYNGKTSS